MSRWRTQILTRTMNLLLGPGVWGLAYWFWSLDKLVCLCRPVGTGSNVCRIVFGGSSAAVVEDKSRRTTTGDATTCRRWRYQKWRSQVQNVNLLQVICRQLRKNIRPFRLPGKLAYTKPWVIFTWVLVWWVCLLHQWFKRAEVPKSTAKKNHTVNIHARIMIAFNQHAAKSLADRPSLPAIYRNDPLLRLIFGRLSVMCLYQHRVILTYILIWGPWPEYLQHVKIGSYEVLSEGMFPQGFTAKGRNGVAAECWHWTSMFEAFNHGQQGTMFRDECGDIDQIHNSWSPLQESPCGAKPRIEPSIPCSRRLSIISWTVWIAETQRFPSPQYFQTFR
jgi:hypothetical protein